MRNPCQLGLRCPCMGHDEEGDVCLHPRTPDTYDGEPCAYIEDVYCPLVEPDTEMLDLLSIQDDYPAGEWRELMRRLSVHLDRTYDESGMRAMVRREAAEQAWAAFVGRDDRCGRRSPSTT